jgi:hypothetical protein
MSPPAPQARVRGWSVPRHKGDAASPHPQRTRYYNVAVIHVAGNGSSLFLILSNQSKGEPLIGNGLPRVHRADGPGSRAYR